MPPPKDAREALRRLAELAKDSPIANHDRIDALCKVIEAALSAEALKTALRQAATSAAGARETNANEVFQWLAMTENP